MAGQANTIEESQVLTAADYAAMPELEEGTPMERLTRKEFWSLHEIKGIESKLNANSNTYPFISLYTSNGKCHNIYFSKNAAAILEEMDMEKGSLIEPTFFKEFRFMWSETPALDIKDNKGKVTQKGYTWKVVSAKDGGNRFSEEYFED